MNPRLETRQDSAWREAESYWHIGDTGKNFNAKSDLE